MEKDTFVMMIPMYKMARNLYPYFPQVSIYSHLVDSRPIGFENVNNTIESATDITPSNTETHITLLALTNGDDLHIC